MKPTIISSCVAIALFLSTSAFSQSAKLITYRPGCIYGSLAKYKVNVDNKEMATLKSKSIYETEITPGSHTISPKQSKRAVTIDAEANKTYVVEYKTPIHIFGARPKLKVVTLEQAEKSKKFRKLEKKNSMNG
jgi:hypothetical protein